MKDKWNLLLNFIHMCGLLPCGGMFQTRTSTATIVVPLRYSVYILTEPFPLVWCGVWNRILIVNPLSSCSSSSTHLHFFYMNPILFSPHSHHIPPDSSICWCRGVNLPTCISLGSRRNPEHLGKPRQNMQTPHSWCWWLGLNLRFWSFRQQLKQLSQSTALLVDTIYL